MRPPTDRREFTNYVRDDITKYLQTFFSQIDITMHTRLAFCMIKILAPVSSVCPFVVRPSRFVGAPRRGEPPSVHCGRCTAPGAGRQRLPFFVFFPFLTSTVFFFFFFFFSHPPPAIATLLQKEYRRPFRASYTNSFSIEMPIVLYVPPVVLARARLF